MGIRTTMRNASCFFSFIFLVRAKSRTVTTKCYKSGIASRFRTIRGVHQSVLLSKWLHMSIYYCLNFVFLHHSHWSSLKNQFNISRFRLFFPISICIFGSDFFLLNFPESWYRSAKMTYSCEREEKVQASICEYFSNLPLCVFVVFWKLLVHQL